jgi:hypothetical protein
MAQLRYATAEDDAEEVPPGERCAWPGCTRRRAPGRAGGSGRQKEYCEKADRPGTGRGGGPEHNARNRWAARERALRGTAAPAAGDGEAARGASPATPAGSPPGEPGGNGPDAAPWTYAKLHATELLQRARQQQAAALEALATERDSYARLAEQLQVLADPAALDLEIAAVTLKAGREVAQAAEDAARARQAQLTAQRERDEAIAGRQDAEELLAIRAAELEAEHDRLAGEALDAGLRADSALEQAAASRQEAARARQDAERATREAGQAAQQARQDADQARDTAARQVTEAAARADAAAARAEEAVRRAEERASAERARADAHAERAAGQLATARAAAEAARDEAGMTRAERDTALAEASALRSELAALRADATAAAERAATLRADIGRLREEADRARAERDRDLARLESAHRDAIDAERARALRAEGELDSLRAAQRKDLDG